MAINLNLTNNAIGRIWDGEFKNEEDEVKPIVQVVDIKLLSSSSGQQNERYRILLSDGVHLQQGMLGTQMNYLVHQKKLQKGSVVQLSQFVGQLIQNRKIIIIVELEVILEKCDPIGDPKIYMEGGNGPASALAQQVRTSVPVHSSMVYPGVPPANPSSHTSSTVCVSPQNGSLSTPVMGRAALHNPNPDSDSNLQSYCNSYTGHPGSLGFGTTNATSFNSNTDLGARNPLPSSTTRSYNVPNRDFANRIPEGGLRASSNTYARSMQQTFPQTLNRGPTSKTEGTVKIVPIASLNPFVNRWTIKVRVTSKKEMRNYKNAKGEGKVFSFDVVDSYGGEIQVTCFNATADKFCNMIEAGRVYLISSGTVKSASKNFNHLKNEYNILLESTSTVEQCAEDDSSIPRHQFDFRSISDIENMGNNSIVDVVGVISSITRIATIHKKDGNETQKRSLQLKDMSGKSVELTMWGNFCSAEGQILQTMCDCGDFPVLAVKCGRISDFNGKSVGTVSSSQLVIEPEIEQARKLRAWFDAGGKDEAAVCISKGMGGTDVRKTVSQIKGEGLGTSGQTDWITVHASIAFIKMDNFCYTACPRIREGRLCSKKVSNGGDGQWHCDTCGDSSPQCDYRYILSFHIHDHTGSTWVSAFQECGTEIMGVPAEYLYGLKHSEEQEEDDEKMREIIKGVLFRQYVLKLKVKEESYADETRVKCTVVKAEKLDVSKESRVLLDMLEKFAQEEEEEDPPVNGVKGENIYAGVYLRCSTCGGSGHNPSHCTMNVNRALATSVKY